MSSAPTGNAAQDSYRPTPFWFLNHALDRDELTRQISLMREAKVSGFFMHPRAGLRIPYTSDAWHDIVRHMVVEAEKAGLKAWLYDDDPFPTGGAGGRVMMDHPEYAARCMDIQAHAPDDAGRFSARLGPGRLLYAVAVRRSGDGTILETKDITSKVGVIRPDFFKAYWPSSYYVDMFETTTFPHFRAECYNPELVLDLAVEEGGWTAYTAVAHPAATGEKWGTWPDCLSREAMRLYMRYTHEAYEERLGEFLGTTIPGIFLDEPKPSAYGAPPWTPDFDQTFADIKGYRFGGEFFRMITGDSEQDDSLREDYWEIIHHLYRTALVEPLAGWCKRNNLELVGHFLCEEDPLSQVAAGDLTDLLHLVDVPGFDHITTPTGSRTYPALSFGGRLPASVAARREVGRVLCESMGCNPFNYGPGQWRRETGWLLALGITWLVPHGFHYSYDGHRKFDAGKSFFFQDPDFASFPAFSDWATRLGARLGEASWLADVALYCPMSRLRQLRTAHVEKAQSLRDRIFHCSCELFARHVEFHIIAERDMDAGNVAGGRIAAGSASYQAIIVPGADLLGDKQKTLLEKLRAAGVTIIEDDADAPFERNVALPEGTTHTTVTCLDDNAGDRADDLLCLRKQSKDGAVLLWVFNNHPEPGWFRLDGERELAWHLYDADADARSVFDAGGDPAFHLPGYDGVLLEGLSQADPDATPVSFPDAESATPWRFEPQWDYQPPFPCLAGLHRFAVTTEKDGVVTDHGEHPFLQVRDLLGTEMHHLDLRKRPIFDIAKRVASPYPVTLRFSASFALAQEQLASEGDILLIAEGDTFQDDCTIRINGSNVPPEALERARIYDPANLTADISRLLKAGANTLEIVWPEAGEFAGLCSSLYIARKADIGGIGIGT